MNIIVSQDPVEMGHVAGTNAAATIRKAITEKGSANVILATGTFLGGKLFRGEERLTGGRIGENSALKLAEQIRGSGLPMARLKTGTPPRLDGRTINWATVNCSRASLTKLMVHTLPRLVRLISCHGMASSVT